MPLPPPSEPEGREEAERQVQQFVDELLAEAARIARRRDADEASSTHVRNAAANLYAGSGGRIAAGMSSLGGLVAGAGSSAMVSFLLAEKIDPLAVGISGGALAIGVGLLVAGILRR